MKNAHALSRRKFLKLAAIGAAGVSLAACAAPPPRVEAPTQPQPTEAPKAMEPEGEITYVTHDPTTYRDKVKERFNKKYPKIKVNMQQIPSDFPTKIFASAAAGTLADVVRVWEPMVLDFGRAGQLIDLQPYVDAEKDFRPDDFIESLWNFPVIDGKRYGIADGWNGHLLFYNKDLFDAAQVPYPTEDWTWDQYVEAARKISKPDEKIWGSDTIPIGWLHWSYKNVWQNGGQVYNADYTECLLDSPEAAEGVQYWADLLQEAEIMPSPTQAEGLGDLFQTGRVALQRMGSWAIAALAEAKFKWDMVPEPKRKERRTLLHTAFNVIPTTTKNKDIAWLWINELVSPDSLFDMTHANGTPAARRSVNERKPWVREGIEANWDVVPAAGDYGILVPAPPNVGEVEKIQADAFQAIYLGQRKAADAFKEIAPQVTKALQRK